MRPDFGTQIPRHLFETGSYKRQDLFSIWAEVTPHSTFMTCCDAQFRL